MSTLYKCTHTHSKRRKMRKGGRGVLKSLKTHNPLEEERNAYNCITCSVVIVAPSEWPTTSVLWCLSSCITACHWRHLSGHYSTCPICITYARWGLSFVCHSSATRASHAQGWKITLDIRCTTLLKPIWALPLKTCRD